MKKLVLLLLLIPFVLGSFDIDGKTVSFSNEFSSQIIPVDNVVVLSSDSVFGYVDFVVMESGSKLYSPSIAVQDSKDVLSKVTKFDSVLVSAKSPIKLVFPVSGNLHVVANEYASGRVLNSAFSSNAVKGKMSFDSRLDPLLGNPMFESSWFSGWSRSDDSYSYFAFKVFDNTDDVTDSCSLKINENVFVVDKDNFLFGSSSFSDNNRIFKFRIPKTNVSINGFIDCSVFGFDISKSFDKSLFNLYSSNNFVDGMVLPELVNEQPEAVEVILPVQETVPEVSSIQEVKSVEPVQEIEQVPIEKVVEQPVEPVQKVPVEQPVEEKSDKSMLTSAVVVEPSSVSSGLFLKILGSIFVLAGFVLLASLFVRKDIFIKEEVSKDPDMLEIDESHKRIEELMSEIRKLR